MRLLLIIGSGGFLGSIGRYLIQQVFVKYMLGVFPWGTFVVNIAGCLIIGLIAGLLERGNVLSNETRLFLATGICGGFTTFSGFSNESVKLLYDGDYVYLTLYVGLSVMIGIAATMGGLALTRVV